MDDQCYAWYHKYRMQCRQQFPLFYREVPGQGQRMLFVSKLGVYLYFGGGLPIEPGLVYLYFGGGDFQLSLV